MSLLRRFKEWWLGQYRTSGMLGKAALVLVPLFFCSCYLLLALAFLNPGDGRSPATSVADSTVEPIATIAFATTVDPSATALSAATDRPVLPPATATDPPTAAPTQKVEPSPTTGPTRTPAASATPRPTGTPRPSSTPRPTWTPAPSATPAPLPTWTPAPTLPPPTPTTVVAAGGETAVVNYVVDGDTIDVTMNGATYRVRYIGIDTPETDQTCGAEATAANASLVTGQTVTMVRDVSETDRYGRLLRYVYVGDTFVNGALVSGGWAIAKEYPPDTAMAGLLASLMPQGAGVGCALVAAPLPTVPVRAPEPTAPPQGGNCDPSYPTVCIPPPPPDLDCGDIPHRRFQVLPPDPHNFDGSDKDGVGCESG